MKLRRVFVIVCVLMALFTSVAFAKKVEYTDPNTNKTVTLDTDKDTITYDDTDGDLMVNGVKIEGVKETDLKDVATSTSDMMKDLPGYDMLNKIEESFRKMSITGIDRLRGPAMTLLWSLGVISIASTWMLYEGQLRLSFVIETVMKIGFYTFLVMYWGTITGDIGDTFQNAGALASMGSVGSKIDWNAGKVLQLGFKCVAEIWGNITLVGTIAHPIDTIIRVIGLFCVLAGYLLLAFEMLVTRVEWSIFRCLSLIFLPLGVLRFTAGFAQGAIRGMFSYGAKLMVITFLTGIICEQTQLTNTTLSKDASTPETLCLGFAFLALAWIVKSAGALAQGLVSGSPAMSGGAMKAAATGLLGTGVGMVAGAYANASASAPGAALVGKAAGAMATGGTGAIAMGMASKMGMSMAQMTTAMQTMTAASGGGDGGGGTTAKLTGDSQNGGKKKDDNPAPQGKPAQQKVNQDLHQQQAEQIQAENPPVDANGKQQPQNSQDQNAVKPNADNAEAVKNATESGNLDAKNAEGAVASQEGAGKGKSDESTPQGEVTDNKVEAGDTSAVAGATANANETATNNVVNNEDKDGSQEGGDESKVEADKGQADDVGKATDQPAPDMTDDEYKNMVGEDAQVGEDASKFAENGNPPAGTTVEHGAEQPVGGENTDTSAVKGDEQAAAAVGVAAMTGSLANQNNQFNKQPEGTDKTTEAKQTAKAESGENKTAETEQGSKRAANVVPPVGAPAQEQSGEAKPTDKVADATKHQPPADGNLTEEQKMQKQQEEQAKNKVQDGLEGERPATDQVAANQARVGEAEAAAQAGVNGLGGNADLSDAQKLENFAKSNPMEYAYLAAYSKVFDENGNVKASATDDDKANFMYAKGQYERHQQALDAFKEQQQMEAAAKAYQQKSTAGKALGFAGRFTKELAIQAVSNLGPVDFLMDQAQLGVSRARRFRRFKNDQWKTYDSVGGEVGIQRD